MTDNATAYQVYRRLLKTLRPYVWLFAIGMAATIMGSLVDAGLTWLVKPVVDKGFIARDMTFIKWLPLGVIAIFLLRGVTSFSSTYCLTRVGRFVVMEFRQKMFHHLLRLPASYYDQHSSGQLLSMIIYNAEQIAEATTFALLTVVQEGLLAVGLVSVMFILSWKLSLFILVTVPFIAWLLKLTSRRLRHLSETVQDSVADVTHVAEEAIEGYRVIRTFGGETYEHNKFTRATKVNRQRELKVVVTNALGTASVQLIISIPIALILYLATQQFLHISTGSFAAIIAAMVSLRRPLRRLTRVNSMIQKGVAGAKSIFALLDEDVEKDSGSLTVSRARGKIDFNQVAFCYPTTEKYALSELTFTINPGETVALVGRSGSGKSTLVNLLPRFYQVSSGHIFIDDHNVNDYRLADLRQQFSLVSQQVILFNDTVAANIAYGAFDSCNEQDIVAAAKAAHAMEFISDLPNGLHTMVGENGVLLSGGQRQRIAIARALFKNAPILLLDEATSALDTESERLIQAGLEKLMKNRTTVVIAHRLSTIESADRILVMNQGRIVETGKHHELLALGGRYAKLYALQFADVVTAPEVKADAVV